MLAKRGRKEPEEKKSNVPSYVRLPAELAYGIDAFIINNPFYSDRSQYIRIAVRERAEKDGIVERFNQRQNVVAENQAPVGEPGVAGEALQDYGL